VSVRDIAGAIDHERRSLGHRSSRSSAPNAITPSSCEDYLTAASPPNSQFLAYEGLLTSSFMLLASAAASWAATGTCWKRFRPAEPSPAKRRVRGTAQAYQPVPGTLWLLDPIDL
jgi:hypothetical protein